MNDDASQRDDQFRWLHRSGRERGAENVPSNAVTKRPGGAPSLDQLYADAVAALNRVVTTREFDALPRITEALRVTAGSLRETDPARAGVLNNLGSAAQLAYVCSNSLDDLDDAIWYYRAAASSAHEDDPDRALYECNLTLALTDLAAKTNDPALAAEAVSIAKTTTEQTSRQDFRRGVALVRYGNALKLHARLANEPSSDDRSIDVFREAVRTKTGGTAEPSELLISLGSALLRRYERQGAPEDLDEGIAHLGTGVGEMADGDPRRTALCHLANALRLRFRQDGDLADLHAALNELLGVLGVLTPGHPLTGKTMWSLACTAVEHSDSTGEPSQLRRVLRVMSPVVRTIAEDDHDRSMAIAGFGALMRRHFLHGAEVNSLDTAVAAGYKAADCPDTPERRCAVLSSLATTLITRFEHTGDTEDLDRASEIAERAAAVAAEGTTPQHTAWAQLGIVSAHRFRQSSQSSDLEAAIEMFDRALQSMPEAAPERAAVATHLGRALQTLHQQTGRRRLYRWARRVLTEAAVQSTAPADHRLRAASLCGRLAAQAHRWSEALESFSIAVEMLPLVTRGKRVIAAPTTQQRWAFVAADAAACALESGQPERAVELLEHGRCAILADFLPIGGELGGLHRLQPDLADQTVRLRRLLDRPPEEPALSDLERVYDAHRRTHLAQAWDRLLDGVRTQEGQTHHLRPLPFRELSAAAQDGSVVLVNLSRYRSDALVIAQGRVLVVPLPGASPEAAADQASHALAATTRRDSQALADALDWLWHNVTRPVLERLGHVRTPQQHWPRIWWSALGALAFLPVHAATAKGGGPSALDRVISSYTPTLHALLNTRNRPVPRDDGRALVATTADGPHLQQITQYWPAAEVATAADTAPDDMLRLLSQHSWVHVFERSTQYPAHPAASLVLDRDSSAHSLGLVELGQVVVDAAEFGFLHQCTTVDETPSAAAISLPAALGFSGFAHMIGTLWEVDAASSARVRDSVYAELAGSDGFRSDDAGYALHDAANHLRTEYPTQPARWAGWVHVGP